MEFAHDAGCDGNHPSRQRCNVLSGRAPNQGQSEWIHSDGDALATLVFVANLLWTTVCWIPIALAPPGFSLVAGIVWGLGEGVLALPLVAASAYAPYAYFRYHARIIILDLALIGATFAVMYAASLVADS